ncbi:MAG TPA: hypothetical protein VHB46_17940 [Burkholderiales bacterium]|nr:hypothetical protein [Burkholderiales bacterium]
MRRSYAPHALSLCVGFLSLSMEILWVRIFGFSQSGTPQAFAFVLTVYLLGIALGAQYGKSKCTSGKDLWRISGIVLLVAGAYDLLSPWLFAMTVPDGTEADGAILPSVARAVCALLIFISAALKAIVFPIAHHLGSDAAGDRVGRSISRVYAANIVGSTLGPLVTGFVLLDLMTTQHCFVLIGSLTLVAGTACMSKGWPRPAVACACMGIAAVAAALMIAPDYLIRKSSGNPAEPRYAVESRQGVVTAYSHPVGGDEILGGNAYDGRTNLDPKVNSNGINRLLILPALKRDPERVLMIGMSIGTWLKLVTAFPGVRHIDVVEINPGYVEAMNHYPPQASALVDARVDLHIDDGRRWLRAHPQSTYDLIVINATYYWRAYAANLLSREFLRQLRLHMRPGAIVTYNATGSGDAFFTATTVFPHAYLYESFVYAADFDFRSRLAAPEAADALRRLKMDGKPLFADDADAVIRKFLGIPFLTIDQIAGKYSRPLEILTDYNLITEYKYAREI